MPTAAIVTNLIRREIDRFIDAARVRSEYDIDTRRRAMRRYHRSWPLLICRPRRTEELSAALHNASSEGIGFLCDQKFAAGSLILVKLFWHEDGGLRVPAVVRHVTDYRHASLVGCEFALDDEDAMKCAFDAKRWYG